MPTFTVEVTRTSTRTLQLQIEAETAEAARLAALDQSGDLVLPSEPDAEYEATVHGDTGTSAAPPAQVDTPIDPDLTTAITLLSELIDTVSIDDDGDGMLCGSPVDPDDEDSDVEIEVLVKIDQFLRHMKAKRKGDEERAEIVRVLQASTSHLTQEEANELITNDRPIPDSIGYIHIASCDVSVYLALNVEDEIDGVSEGFKNVAAYARSRGIAYIRFDADAPTVPGCATYDW